MDQESCSNCRFWKAPQGDGVWPPIFPQGECRRFPRVLNHDKWVYPPHGPDDWCGEHRIPPWPEPESDYPYFYSSLSPEELDIVFE